jgi:LPS-assembly lipoprotein
MHTPQSPCDRHFFQIMAILLSLAMLAGCGFQLKQSVPLPADFGPVSIEGVNTFSSLYKAIQTQLRQSSIDVVSDGTASHRIVIKNFKNERRVLSVGPSGKVSEYELIMTLTFMLLDGNNNTVTEPQTISTNRSYTVTPNDLLGKNLEEEDIVLRMEQSLVDRMFRYLSSKVQ